MHRIDGPGATADNKFTDGNSTTGVPATEVTAEWATAIQEEAVAVILAAGLELNKADNTQLFQAIQLLIAGGGETVTAAGVGISDAGGYIDGADVEAALQQLAAKLYNGTINANQVRRSVVASSGTAVSTASTHAENIVELSNSAAITYTINPDSTYNAPVGTEIVLVQAGAGQVSIVAGSGVTLRKPASFNAKSLEQHASVVLYKTAANTWRVGGILEAAA